MRFAPTNRTPACTLQVVYKNGQKLPYTWIQNNSDGCVVSAVVSQNMKLWQVFSECQHKLLAFLFVPQEFPFPLQSATEGNVCPNVGYRLPALDATLRSQFQLDLAGTCSPLPLILRSVSSVGNPSSMGRTRTLGLT